MQTQSLTPPQIVAELDKYIIGQKTAKRSVAISLRNRWRRMQAPEEIRGDITPNNLLMIGPTGVGKTEIARRLARLADAPFIKVEASKFTEVGYVGRDVESMVRDLVEQSVRMVKAAKEESVRKKASAMVEDIILDALVPKVTDKTAPEIGSSNEESTREHFKSKLRAGCLEDNKITISLNRPNSASIGMVGSGMMDESTMSNLQDMLNSMLPNKKSKRKVTIAEARLLLFPEESAKLIDMDAVKDQALEKASNAGIIFIDEIDKITSKSGRNDGEVSREGVQRDLLPIVEGSSVTTKYGIVQTDHILFIAAGAFHASKPSDLIPELQGRFPIRVELSSLTEADFVRILKEPNNALTAQYQALFAAEGVKIIFEDSAIQALARTAFQLNEQIENIGARRLHTVMSHLLNNFLFDVPEKLGTGSIIQVTEKLVQERLTELANQKDLREYIL